MSLTGLWIKNVIKSNRLPVDTLSVHHYRVALEDTLLKLWGRRS
jgi:hypothetical protein